MTLVPWAAGADRHRKRELRSRGSVVYADPVSPPRSHYRRRKRPPLIDRARTGTLTQLPAFRAHPPCIIISDSEIGTTAVSNTGNESGNID
ncbi:hypothetical protein Zmor_008418 [Zophobas morio]|uniref:Uncharacterized protein n=1 Tax=Zophobas morio TaxID=2755281 RepID=A0AA38J0C2_9CUCU|nr:hypothetical protein Zmor_008418 [Zophobas morio]